MKVTTDHNAPHGFGHDEQQRNPHAGASAGAARMHVSVTHHDATAARQGNGTGSNKTKLVVVWTAIIALMCGVAGGYALSHAGTQQSSGASSTAGVTSLTSDDLDSTIGSYTHDGITTQITVRQVMEESPTSAAVRNADGTYAVPDSSLVLTAARHLVLNGICDSEGITVTDDEMNTYADVMFGTTDYDEIADSCGLDADSMRASARNGARRSKLKTEKTNTEEKTVPTPPTAPDGTDGNSSSDSSYATEEYGKYVTALVGDEWNNENQTWARTDGPYYEALDGLGSFTSTSATFDQATAAYSVAYQEYAASLESPDTAWLDYVNGETSDVSVNIDALSTSLPD